MKLKRAYEDEEIVVVYSPSYHELKMLIMSLMREYKKKYNYYFTTVSLHKELEKRGLQISPDMIRKILHELKKQGLVKEKINHKYIPHF
ncbi:hypothetical protein M1425_0512 [Sulfolobus islandicus M.14.25]|uniref:Plasmid pARN4 n=1 Tax=Saccharolobus islandicus (strain M.14.25 / Kamchatka \|nr:hypothetical protein [Sulfolobus islandicus]ACP37363.1 hypothetical protein M1425_0512 [Sulfolobus islandicus M.14.25]